MFISMLTLFCITNNVLNKHEIQYKKWVSEIHGCTIYEFTVEPLDGIFFFCISIQQLANSCFCNILQDGPCKVMSDK